MSNSTSSPFGRGLCPAPFLDLSEFPSSGGYHEGRLCLEVRPGTTCCLPCPATDWIYPESFKTWQKVAQGLSVAGVIVCVFLLLSWICLPVEKSRRHYLSTCLVIGILLEVIAFVIPLAAQPTQCHNAITPNDMRSDITCAFSGACVMLGGLVTTVWITFRALSMHLQICWDVIPGKKFFYISLSLGWAIAAAIFLSSMAVTGVSYRFGDVCHVNPGKALADFWIPLLVMAGLATTLQLGTLVYCCKVYMANAFSDTAQSYGTGTNASELPQYTSSTRTHSARVVWQRVKKIMMLQWRAGCIIAFLLIDIIFFSIVWIELDDSITRIQKGNTSHITPFLSCLIAHPSVEQRAKCFPLGQDALVSEKVAVCVLLLLALTGVQTGLLMIRSAMLTGWIQLFRNLFNRRREFVSLDAKRNSADPRTIPMTKFHHTSEPRRVTSAGTIDTAATAVEVQSFDETTPSLSSKKSPFFAQHPFDRPYRQPRGSFSAPRPASASNNVNVSPRPAAYEGAEPNTNRWGMLGAIQDAPNNTEKHHNDDDIQR